MKKEQRRMLAIEFIQFCTEVNLNSDTPLSKKEIADWWLKKFEAHLKEVAASVRMALEELYEAGLKGNF